MRKVIKGKSYDTHTAERVGVWHNGRDPGDSEYEAESLYRKKTGEFFVYGRGGARSQYGEPYYDWWTAGEKIIPLSVEEAKKWAEGKLTKEEFYRAFYR